MRDNIIIGILTGCVVAGMDFWEFDSIWQPVLIIAFIAWWLPFVKLELEEKAGKLKDRRAATHGGQTE